MVGILLLTSLNAFAESAASEDGVLDYSIFENDPAYAFEIDRFDKTWTASVEVTGDASSLSMLMSVMGNLDGEVHFFALGLPYSTECEKVQFLIDETVYSFDLSLVTDALYLAIIFLTPDTYAFFRSPLQCGYGRNAGDGQRS